MSSYAGIEPGISQDMFEMESDSPVHLPHHDVRISESPLFLPDMPSPISPPSLPSLTKPPSVSPISQISQVLCDPEKDEDALMEVEVRIDCENIQHLGFDYQYLEEKSEQRESQQADKESEDELIELLTKCCQKLSVSKVTDIILNIEEVKEGVFDNLLKKMQKQYKESLKNSILK